MRAINTRFILKFIALFFVFAFLSNLVFAEPCSPAATPCPPGATCPPCEPQTLPQIQELIVQLISFVYVTTGFVFFGIFVYNAYLYMFNKVEDSKKRMTQWIIGILMILFSQPIVATLMQSLIGQGNACYDSLRNPSFKFFFPQVCEDVSPTPISPVPTKPPCPSGQICPI